MSTAPTRPTFERPEAISGLRVGPVVSEGPVRGAHTIVSGRGGKEAAGEVCVQLGSTTAPLMVKKVIREQGRTTVHAEVWCERALRLLTSVTDAMQDHLDEIGEERPPHRTLQPRGKAQRVMIEVTPDTRCFSAKGGGIEPLEGSSPRRGDCIVAGVSFYVAVSRRKEAKYAAWPWVVAAQLAVVPTVDPRGGGQGGHHGVGLLDARCLDFSAETAERVYGRHASDSDEEEDADIWIALDQAAKEGAISRDDYTAPVHAMRSASRSSRSSSRSSSRGGSSRSVVSSRSATSSKSRRHELVEAPKEEEDEEEEQGKDDDEGAPVADNSSDEGARVSPTDLEEGEILEVPEDRSRGGRTIDAEDDERLHMTASSAGIS